MPAPAAEEEGPKMSALNEMESAIHGAAERLGASVVGIGRGWGRGSGFVIEPGRVLTCAHNIRGEEVTVSFSESAPHVGRVAGIDEELDLALVEVDTDDAVAFAWEDGGGGVPAGRFVLAMSNPGGRGLRATPGFVSGAVRAFRAGRGRRLAGAIEHTAPLPRGSSGGPLIDAEGRLIGINAVRVDPGLILAIPADSATRERIEALGRGERPQSVRLGVAVAPPRVARRLRRAVGLPERDGVLIRAVQDGSPAERAGLERGDLLVAAGNEPLDRLDALYEALDRARDAGELELGVLRGADERTVQVVF